MVGVNGTGKTTVCGKLARALIGEGQTVVLGAADTFRAAAADQLETWGRRTGAQVVRSDREEADPASVAFEAVRVGIDERAGTVIVDTAGRLHTKTGLMDELGKIKRVIEKQAPVDEVLLVLDATTGQNGLRQARVFAEAVDMTGIVLTKLDGTAKGGIVIAVQRELGVPVKLVGLGEGPGRPRALRARGLRRRDPGQLSGLPWAPGRRWVTVGGCFPVWRLRACSPGPGPWPCSGWRLREQSSGRGTLNAATRGPIPEPGQPTPIPPPAPLCPAPLCPASRATGLAPRTPWARRLFTADVRVSGVFCPFRRTVGVICGLGEASVTGGRGGAWALGFGLATAEAVILKAVRGTNLSPKTKSPGELRAAPTLSATRGRSGPPGRGATRGSAAGPGGRYGGA